jgi:soluble cytochrome b562
MAKENVSLEWGDACFRPTSVKELEEACRENDEGSSILWLCDVEAAGGEFGHLESFLAEHHIPYTQRREGKYEYEPLVVEYRPGMENALFLKADNAGQLVAPVQELRAAEMTLAEAIQQVREGSPTSVDSLEAAIDLLRKGLPPLVSSLEPFQIIPA